MNTAHTLTHIPFAYGIMQEVTHYANQFVCLRTTQADCATKRKEHAAIEWRAHALFTTVQNNNNMHKYIIFIMRCICCHNWDAHHIFMQL